ncbi:MAG TPA: T9SS type A sorting domain-containing protein [Bacteroidia bacterium]|nr:T9SS type A sorting domain-containing protein [Bacteroidia bacterium]
MIGNFWNASNGLKQIAKFDGTSWQPVGNGFSIGAITNVLAVYNNELFIGGYFSTPADPGNMLVKWNGTTYVQLPAVPDDQVLSMKVIGGKLYVGGNYSNAGGVSNTAFVSRWDGSQWESLGGVFNNGVNCFAEMNGDIYIGGGFYTVDGDSVHRIVRYTGASLGINDASTSLNMTGNVFPNPSNGEFTIKIPEEFNDAFTVCIYDVLGQVVFKDNFTSEKNIPIGISDKPKGIYFLRINSGNQQVTQKIIIE